MSKRGTEPSRRTVFRDKAKAKSAKARADELAKTRKAGAKAEAAAESESSPRSALKRAEHLEREAYKLAEAAIKTGEDADSLIKAHTNAARNVIALRAEVVKLEQEEGRLLPGDWVRDMANKHDAVLAQALQGMPRRMAQRISPHDPTFAEQTLSEWVQGVMKTMHDTSYAF